VSAVVRTRRLTKRYGHTTALRHLDLEVRAGEVFGLLGPNGAGKTTTLRPLVDLIGPTSGQVLLFDQDLRTRSVALRRRIGYLPGELALYENLTGAELLRLFASFRGQQDLTAAHRLADRFALDLDRKTGELPAAVVDDHDLVVHFGLQGEMSGEAEAAEAAARDHDRHGEPAFDRTLAMRARVSRNATMTKVMSASSRFTSYAGRQETSPALTTKAPVGLPETPKPPPSPSCPFSSLPPPPPAPPPTTAAVITVTPSRS
jgi:ABC-type sugar transport system ATPase subunit